jgi:hypothetical protein
MSCASRGGPQVVTRCESRRSIIGKAISATLPAGAGPGGGLGDFELISEGNGNDRLGFNESATATFTFTNLNVTTLTLDSVIVHLTSLPNEGSEKVPPSSVPEPVTMLLFGTGLAGIAAKVRRRRKA